MTINLLYKNVLKGYNSGFEFESIVGQQQQQVFGISAEQLESFVVDTSYGRRGHDPKSIAVEFKPRRATETTKKRAVYQQFGRVLESIDATIEHSSEPSQSNGLFLHRESIDGSRLAGGRFHERVLDVARTNREQSEANTE